jgi:hypothetical protein
MSKVAGNTDDRKPVSAVVNPMAPQVAYEIAGISAGPALRHLTLVPPTSCEETLCGVAIYPKWSRSLDDPTARTIALPQCPGCWARARIAHAIPRSPTNY